MAEREVTPEQLAEAIRGLKVSDLVVSTCSTLAQLGYAKLEPVTRDLRAMLTNLQLAYAPAASG